MEARSRHAPQQEERHSRINEEQKKISYIHTKDNAQRHMRIQTETFASHTVALAGIGKLIHVDNNNKLV